MTSKARTREHYGARSYASEVAAPAGTGGRRISSLTKVRRRGPVRRRSMKIYLCMPSDRNPKKVIRANRFSGLHTLLRRKTGDRDNRARLSQVDPHLGRVTEQVARYIHRNLYALSG